MSMTEPAHDASSAQPGYEPQPAEPGADLIAAIQSGEVEAMAAAWQQTNQLSPVGAAAAIKHVSEANLAEVLVKSLHTRAQSLNTAAAWSHAAEVAFAFGDEEIAKAAAGETLHRDPSSVNAVFILAVLANRRGEFDQASRAINELFDTVPEAKRESSIIIQLIVAMLGQWHPQEALATLDPVFEDLVAAGSKFDAYVLKARALAMMPERGSETTTAWENAMQTATPEQAAAVRLEYVDALSRVRRYDDALKEIEPVIKTTADPMALAVLQRVRANIFAEKGDFAGAIAAIEDLLSLIVDRKQRIEARLVQARLEVNRGQLSSAAARFDAALEEAKREKTKTRNEIRLQKARALAMLDVDLVAHDLDKLDKAEAGTEWPEPIDLRIGGLVIKGRVEEALEWFEDRLARAPQLATHPAAHQLRGDINLKLGRADVALAEYAQAINVSPDATDKRAWGAALMGAFTTQQWDLAVSIYEQCPESIKSMDSSMSVIAAVAYARSNRPETALKLTQEEKPLAAAVAPFRIQARAEAQMRLSQFDEVLKTVEGLTPADTSFEFWITAQLMRVQALNALGRFDEAAKFATAALEADHPTGDSLPGLVSLMRVALLLQRSGAFQQLKRVGDSHRDLDRGLTELEGLRSSVTVELLSASPEFDSLEYWLWLVKGDLLERAERNEESLAAYTRAYRIERAGSFAAIARGRGLTNTGAFTDAVIVFDEAISRAASATERANAFAGKGRALVRLKRFEQAITALQASLDARLTDPVDDSFVFELLGISYDAVGRHEAALKAFRQAWRLTKDLKQKPNLARGISSCYLRAGFASDAIAFLNKEAGDIDEPTIIFNRALAFDAVGDRRQAIKNLLRAKKEGLGAAQAELDRLDKPAGLGRWTYHWFGKQATPWRRITGVVLALVAASALAAPFYQWWFSAKVDWYLLLVPAVAALVLLALPNIQSITYEDGKLKLSAEPLAATGREATTGSASAITASAGFAEPLGPLAGFSVPTAALASPAQPYETQFKIEISSPEKSITAGVVASV